MQHCLITMAEFELSADNNTKIDRQIKALSIQLTEEGISGSESDDAIALRKKELQSLYSMKEWKCPKVRFGKTELQMPIIT